MPIVESGLHLLEVLEDKVYIYGLVDPRSDAVRYIGKSQDLNYRFKQHLKLKGFNPHKDRWIKQLIDLNLQPKITILEEVEESSWEEAEIRWIAHGRVRGWPLTNLLEGGNGGRQSEEGRRKISLSVKARLANLSPEERAKWKQNLSKGQKARIARMTLEERRQQTTVARAISIGSRHPHKEETKRQMSKSHLAYNVQRTPEERRQKSTAGRLACLSEEARRKKGKSKKRHYANLSPGEKEYLRRLNSICHQSDWKTLSDEEKQSRKQDIRAEVVMCL